MKTRRHVHAFGDRERLGRTDDARATETDVDVAEHRHRRVGGERGRLQLVDAVAVIDRRR